MAEEHSTRVMEYGLLSAAFIIGAVLMASFFMWLPTEGTTLGIDLLMSAFDGGQLHYKPIFGLLNPPWSVLPLIPLVCCQTKPVGVCWYIVCYAC